MKSKKDKIVYTAGVWDCFHIGHLNLLKEASKLGSKLIVGVSNDELVLDYKNKTPLIPFKERLEIIKSIRYVDSAIEQKSRDKLKALEIVHFNIWAIGNDWMGNQYYMDTSERFGQLGIETVWLPYTKGISSTHIKKLLTGRR